MALTEDRRKQLDGIVGKMTANGEKEGDIRFVVEDFKSKYGAETAPTPNEQHPILSAIASPFKKGLSSLAAVGEGVGRLAMGDVKGAQEAQTKERSFGVFGTARPVGIEQETGKMLSTGQGIKDILGTGAEAASWLAPVGAVKGAVGAAKGVSGLLPRIGAAARAGAPFGALGGAMQSGGAEVAKPSATLGSVLGETAKGGVGGGIAGAAIPGAGVVGREGLRVAGKVIQPATRAATQFASKTLGEAPARLLNSVIKPLEKEFRFGRDPGRTVVEERLVANTDDELAKAITVRKREVGDEIEKALTTPQASVKKIDLRPAINTIDSEIEKAIRNGEQALVSRLRNIKDGLEFEFVERGGQLVKSTPKNLIVSPKDAQLVKRSIGEASKWTGQAFDNEANQARVRIYSSINDQINKAVPEVEKLNDRYGGLLSAEKSIERTMNVGRRQQLGSVGDIVTGGIGVGAFGPAGLLAIAGRRFMESTAFKTRLAQFLSKLGQPEEIVPKLLNATEAERGKILNVLPVFQRIQVAKELKEAIKIIPKKVGDGEFGPVFSGPKDLEAFEALLTIGEGEIKDALRKVGIGDIDLVFGKPGKDGFGVAHIESEHPGFYKEIPRVVREGKVFPQAKDRKIIVVPHKDGDEIVSVKLDWDGKEKNWILTGYKKENPNKNSRV